MRFNSRFGLDDEVVVFAGQGLALAGQVKGVRFIALKVLYDVELDAGGQMLRDVDSTYVGREVEGAGVAVSAESVAA